jgi:hypothetical protein
MFIPYAYKDLDGIKINKGEKNHDKMLKVLNYLNENYLEN